MKKYKGLLYYFIHFIIILIIGILIGKIIEKNKFSLTNESAEGKIRRLITYIERDYVDDVDTHQLLDETITDMLEKLDPHSIYLSKDVLQHEKESMAGKFFGIGVQFITLKDTILVTKVIEKGPAEKAGIKAGDRIVKADHHLLTTQSILEAKNISTESDLYSKNQIINEFIMDKLRGKKGENVLLSIYRKPIDSLLSISVSRDEIPIKSVEGGYMINNRLGYIEITRFAQTTHDEFHQTLQKLIHKGMKALILDLRDNPGGYMKTAFDIADEFLENGKLVVFTKNKYKRINDLIATEKGLFESQNVYVLINQNSASASEIVAGALQDNDRGTIVGRRSFGKGLVQQQMELGDGSAVRLTTSRYYTPTGRSIQKPYAHNQQQKYLKETRERYKNGELYSKDSIKKNDSLVFKTPKGKIVYGGGGIIPDVFVPIDSTKSFSYKVYGHLNTFIYHYLDTHRTELTYWTKHNAPIQIDTDQKILKTYLKKYNIANISTTDKKEVHNYLKSLLLKNLGDEKSYYHLIHQNDRMIQKVLELERVKTHP